MKSIFYFVDSVSESFVLNDIRQVASNYKKVYLFSTNELVDIECLPANVEVYDEYIDWKSFKGVVVLVKNIFSVSFIYLQECWYSKRALPFKESIKLIVSNIFKANQIVKVISSSAEMSAESRVAVFYSFWFWDCIYLAWLRKKGILQKVVVRAHGGDLYTERASLGTVLIRNFQFKHIDLVLAVSKNGREYLKSQYIRWSKKIDVSYLGSLNTSSAINPFDPYSSDFVLISCSLIRDIKRVYLIAESLLHVGISVKWYHIGGYAAQVSQTDPYYSRNIEKLVNMPNIEFISLGVLPNEQVLDFYKRQKINLFISLSESEGLPVSIIEAISFGIPVLATDAGGCKEIVTDQTGLLVPIETSAAEIAKVIESFRYSSMNTQHFRKGVNAFWLDSFEIDKNYSLFFRFLSNVNTH